MAEMGVVDERAIHGWHPCLMGLSMLAAHCLGCRAELRGNGDAFLVAPGHPSGACAMGGYIDQEGYHDPEPAPASYADAGGIGPDVDQRHTWQEEQAQQRDNPDTTEYERHQGCE